MLVWVKHDKHQHKNPFLVPEIVSPLPFCHPQNAWCAAHDVEHASHESPYVKVFLESVAGSWLVLTYYGFSKTLRNYSET